MNTRRDTVWFLAVGVVGLLILALSIFSVPGQAGAAVATGEEYSATTTYAAHPSEVRVLKSGFGALASVVITGDNTGLMTLYNATTSNVNLRTGNKATSTLVIADFPASTPEGTYVFDATVTDGLLLVTSGAEATSTITYR